MTRSERYITGRMSSHWTAAKWGESANLTSWMAPCNNTKTHTVSNSWRPKRWNKSRQHCISKWWWCQNNLFLDKKILKDIFMTSLMIYSKGIVHKGGTAIRTVGQSDGHWPNRVPSSPAFMCTAAKLLAGQAGQSVLKITRIDIKMEFLPRFLFLFCLSFQKSHITSN